MEKLSVKSESDEVSMSPSCGGAAATLPKFTPGTKGAPKKITQIKFIDPEKIKQLGLEKTIAAAVHKLKVKTQGSGPQNTEGSQFGALFGTTKSILFQNSRKTSNASNIKELPSSNTSQDGKHQRRPTTINVSKLIKKKLVTGKRSSLNLKCEADEKISAKIVQALSRSCSGVSPKPPGKKAAQIPSTPPKAQNEVVVNPEPEEPMKKSGRPKKIKLLEKSKNLEGLTKSELIVRKATEQLRLTKPKQYKNTSASVLRIPSPSKTVVSSEVKKTESTQVPDESPKKSCSNEDSSKIPSFLNLRHYLHHKRSHNEGSENSSDSTETSRDKLETKPENVGEEEKILEKQSSYNPSPAPISVLKVRKKGPLVKKPEETLVPGKIDVILTTDADKDKKDEIKVLSDLQKPSEESDEEPRTVVLKVINRDLKSGKIEMELIDPLIQPEKVQAVVTNSTVDSEDVKEKITDTALDVGKESTDGLRSTGKSNLNIPGASQVPQRTYSSSSSADESLDSSDLFKKHLKTIFPTKPIKKVEEVVRKLSFSDTSNKGSVTKANSTKTIPSNISVDAINTKSAERGSLFENEHFVDCHNTNAVPKSSTTTSTCSLSFGGFFKKTTSELEFHGTKTEEEPTTAGETAVDFLLTVKDKVDDIPSEDSLPSDCDSASLTEFDNLFDIKESSSSDKILKESKNQSNEESPHNPQDPLTVEESNSPYYELLGFEGDKGVIRNFNHCDDYLIQAKQEENLRPIIIENKILSDQEKIDTMAVLSQVGHQMSPSMKLPPTTDQVSNQSDNHEIIMGDDLPAQEEVELFTVYSADNSNNDVIDDYGYDGDGDVELLSVEESPESSNHSLASKSVQDQNQVEILKIVSSAETTTDQVIVLSVEHNAEALGDAEGSIEFPFDSPIKKQPEIVEIDENVADVESPEFEQLQSDEDVTCESHTETSEIIKKIEQDDNEIPIPVYLPVEDKETIINEATDDGRNSSKSSNCDVTTDQSSLKDNAQTSSDDQQSELILPSKRSKPSESNEAKQETTDEKRARKTFRPVPKLRLALKNKKKSINTKQIAEDSKENAVEKDEVKQSSCEDGDQKPTQTNDPLSSISQSSSESRIVEEVEQEINQQNKDNQNQLEDYVVLRKEENPPVKSILRRDKKIDCQQYKENKEKNPLLLNQMPESIKGDDFAESKTEEDHLKTTKNEENKLCEAGSNKQLIREEDVKSSNEKTKTMSHPNGKNPQLQLQSDRQCEVRNIEDQSTKTDEEHIDLQNLKRSSDTECEESSIQLPNDVISGKQTPFLESVPTNQPEDTKDKIIKKGDRRKNELNTLKPKQKTLVDYLSSCKQNQDQQDQLGCMLRSSLNDSKGMDQVSKESNETSSCTDRPTDLADIVKKDFEKEDTASTSHKVKREVMRLGELKQYHRKSPQKTIVYPEEKHQDSFDLKDREKYSSDVNKESASQFVESGGAEDLSRIADDNSDLSRPISNNLNVQEVEKKVQIVSETINNDAETANVEESIKQNKRGRSRKKSKISILEKWSHTEGTISKVEKAKKSVSTEEDVSTAKSMLPKTEKSKLLNCEENSEDPKSLEAEKFGGKIKSTPNPNVKKKYNRKSEPDNVSKGYSVMKVADNPNGDDNIKKIVEEVAADTNSESSTPNLKRIKVEDDSVTPDKPAEIPKKRGRKPKSVLPDVSSVVDIPAKVPNVPVLAEKSRRGRIIKLTEKRRLSEIFNESKAKQGRKRKYQLKEPDTDTITKNVENDVVPLKKPKLQKIVNFENSNSDSDSDVPLSEKMLKSKNGVTSAPTRRRRTPNKVNKIKSKAEKITTSSKTDSSEPERKRKARERKYDIEIKLHPKLLFVTKREDLYKEDNVPRPPVKLKKGEVQCGLCKEITLEDKWAKHVESHYCIGWKEGEPPIDVEDYRTVLNTMNKYIRHNHIGFIYCRLCDTPMKSAIGLLFHLETCKATLEEKKEMNFTCVCGKVLISKLWAPPHYRTCKGPPDQIAQEEISPAEPEPSTCSRKRKAVLKAEKMIKEKIKEELQEEMPEDLIKPIVNKTAGYMTKWRFQLRKKGKTFCVGKDCDFTSEDLPTMHEHSKTCDKILWTGFTCIRCRFEDASKDVVLKHVEQKHKSEKTQDFQDSGSEAKVGSESSDSDNESGNENNVEKKKQHKTTKRPTKHTELYSDKWKKVFRLRANSDCLNEVVNWTRSFRESNYSKKAIFTNIIPEATVLPYTTTHQYFAYNVESMKFSYNFENWCNRKFSSSIKPEIWTKLRMLESTITNDEMITFIGGPVTNVVWVPVGDHETSKQYLAVTYKKDFNEYIKYRDDAGTYKTCMLIFEIEYIPTGQLKSLLPLYGVALDSGHVLDIQFLPSGGFAPALNRLGLVTVVSKKTDPEMYSLPLRVSKTENCDIKGFPIVKLRPSAVLRLDSNRGFDWTRQCTALVWSKFKGHNIIAGALMNGYVAVWDISEEDNLNKIKKDDEVCIVPTNLFMAADRRVLAIDLHYDAYGVRWIILSTECKEIKLFDLRDVTPCAVIIDDFLRNMVYSLEWPVYWDNPILSYSDEMQKAVTGIFSFSPMGIMYHYRKAIKCAAGVVTSSFIDWQNLHVVGCVNGDLIGHRCCEWRHDVALQINFAEKYLSYTDLVSLDGDRTELTKLNPSLLKFFDKDYKEKYGLILSKFQRCRKYEQEAQSERDVHFTLQQYVKINRVAGNPNAFGKELIAAGYENGLLRICLYNYRKSCS